MWSVLYREITIRDITNQRLDWVVFEELPPFKFIFIFFKLPGHWLACALTNITEILLNVTLIKLPILQPTNQSILLWLKIEILNLWNCSVETQPPTQDSLLYKPRAFPTWYLSRYLGLQVLTLLRVSLSLNDIYCYLWQTLEKCAVISVTFRWWPRFWSQCDQFEFWNNKLDFHNSDHIPCDEYSLWWDLSIAL